MARYRRGYRRYRRRYRSGWPYRSWRRFGVSASQKSGTRRFTISIPVEGYCSVAVDANSHNSHSIGFTPFYNSTNTNAALPEFNHRNGNLVQNNLFITYCSLYDEVKINSMSVAVSVDGAPQGTNGVKVVSCVDRHVTLNDIRTAYLVSNMFGSAESSSRMFSSLQNAKVYRYIPARDIGEKTSFFDSTLGTLNYGNYQLAGPLEFISNTSLYGCYNPIVFFGFSFSTAPLAAGTVYVQYRVTYNLTFRNPKYGGSINSRGEGFSEMKSEVVEDMKGVEDVGEESELDEETVRKIKALLHEDVQLPLTLDEKKDEMVDDEKDEKVS